MTDLNLRKTDLIDIKVSGAVEFDEVYLAEKFKENISDAALMSSTNDTVTQKLISLEDEGHQPDIAIIERTKMMLEDCFGSNFSKENTNSLI